MVVLAVFLLFAGIAAIAIIISRGGTLTDSGLVLESGVVRIQTDPADLIANFYLNDKEIKLQDKRINGLLAGEYTIRIEAEGYSSWEKTIKVDSGIVLDISAKLYPVELALSQLTNTNIDRAFFSESGEYVYYTVTNSQFGSDIGIWRMRLAQSQFIFSPNQNQPEKISNLTPELKDLFSAGSYELIPSPDNNRLMIKDDNNTIFVLSIASNPSVSPTNLETTLGFPIDHAAWFNNSGSIVVRSGKLLVEYNLNNSITTLVTFANEDDLIYAANNFVVYVIRDNAIWQYQNSVLTPLKLENIQLPEQIDSIYTPTNSRRFLALKSGENYYYLDSEKSLLYKIDEPDLEYYAFSQDGRALLFKNNDLLLAFSVREVIALNTIETKLINTELAIVKDKDIAKFVPQSSHFLHYKNGDDHVITVTEKDGSNQITLLNNSGIKNSDFGFDSTGNRFIVLLQDESADIENASSNLYTINLEKP